MSLAIIYLEVIIMLIPNDLIKSKNSYLSRHMKYLLNGVLPFFYNFLFNYLI